MKRFIPVLVCLAGAVLVQAQTTKEEQGALTPDKVLTDLMAGNSRFVSGKLQSQDIKARVSKSANGQYPKAVILSCVDSRVPAEMVFDQGIGDVFVARVAGNVAGEDELGSMEFAAKLADVKLVFILGHSACGAVKGACDGAELGNLTTLLAKIKPAVEAAQGFKPDERNSKNKQFVDAVVDGNVRHTIAAIRKDSPVLTELEAAGHIKIVGGIYDLQTGKVALLK